MGSNHVHLEETVFPTRSTSTRQEVFIDRKNFMSADKIVGTQSVEKHHRTDKVPVVTSSKADNGEDDNTWNSSLHDETQNEKNIYVWDHQINLLNSS